MVAERKVPRGRNGARTRPRKGQPALFVVLASTRLSEQLLEGGPEGQLGLPLPRSHLADLPLSFPHVTPPA